MSQGSRVRLPPSAFLLFFLYFLLDEINNKKILCNKQIGFIKGCGTELNLLRLKQRINDVKKERNKFNKYLVFIDLKNAYDKVIHTKLFEKLKNYRVDDKLINTIKLIKTFIKNMYYLYGKIKGKKDE